MKLDTDCFGEAVDSSLCDELVRQLAAKADTLVRLEELKQLIGSSEKYQCFGGLVRDVDAFLHGFKECSKDDLAKAETVDGVVDSEAATLISLATHQVQVAEQFMHQKGEEMGAIDRYIDMLTANGFQLFRNELPTSGEKPLCFLVDLSFFDDLAEESVGVLVSSLQSCPGRRKSRKKSRQYKWWTDPEVTQQFDDALLRKKSNDRANLTGYYWVGLLHGDEDTEDDDESGESCLLMTRAPVSNGWERWETPAPPDSLRTSVTTSAVGVGWSVSRADTSVCYVVSLYTVKRGEEKEDDERVLVGRNIVGTTGYCRFEGLKPDSRYFLEVHSLSPVQGASAESSTADFRTEKPVSIAKRMHQCIESGRSAGVGNIGKDGRALVLSCVERRTEMAKARHLPRKPDVVCLREVDVAPAFAPEEQFGAVEDALVVILCGATGAGKSTHINAMVNWLFGVTIDDPFRILLIDDSGMKSTHSVTQNVNVYRIRHLAGMPIQKSLVIVDSPGYGDSRGLAADEFTTSAFRMLFRQLGHVNCVGLVVKASDERLTSGTKYVFEKMLQLFHKSIEGNILPICTFADHAPPPCLNGIIEDGIPCRHHVKVQNSMFSCRFDESKAGAPPSASLRQERRLYWQLAYNGIAGMFNIITQHMPQRPLGSSNVVLEKRLQLQETLQVVTDALSGTTTKVANIMQLLNIAVDVLGNAPEETVTVMKSESVKMALPVGKHVTLCQNCNVTCHYGCKIANDEKKRKCSAMRKGFCTVCPGKCIWSDHHNAEYYWGVKTSEEKVVPQELINRWADKNGSSESAILEGMSRLENEQAHVTGLLNLAVELKEQLEKDSLRHNPRVTLAYVESLIEMHKDRGAPSDVLKALNHAKKQLKLQHESRHQQAVFAANKAALECIKVELVRRSKLDVKARLKEETTPSDFYNKVLSKVPLDLHSELPAMLEQSTGWFGFRVAYPPFRESLKRTGEALKVLLSMGVS